MLKIHMPAPKYHGVTRSSATIRSIFTLLSERLVTLEHRPTISVGLEISSTETFLVKTSTFSY